MYTVHCRIVYYTLHYFLCHVRPFRHWVSLTSSPSIPRVNNSTQFVKSHITDVDVSIM